MLFLKGYSYNAICKMTDLIVLSFQRKMFIYTIYKIKTDFQI